MEYLRRALNDLPELDDPRRLVCLLETAARIALASGSTADSVRLLSYTAARRKSLNYPPPPVHHPRIASTLEKCRTSCGDYRFSELWAAGERFDAEDAAVLVLQLTEAAPAPAP